MDERLGSKEFNFTQREIWPFPLAPGNLGPWNVLTIKHVFV